MGFLCWDVVLGLSDWFMLMILCWEFGLVCVGDFVFGICGALVLGLHDCAGDFVLVLYD